MWHKAQADRIRQATGNKHSHHSHHTKPNYPVPPSIITSTLDDSASSSQDIEVKEDNTHLAPSPIGRAPLRWTNSRKETSLSSVLTQGEEGVEVMKLHLTSRRSDDSYRSAG